MTVVEPATPRDYGTLQVERGVSYVQWGPVVAGALTAAALAFVLQTFAVAIGLAISSTSPTWRDSSFFLQLLSGFYLIFVSIVAFGVGGYLVGRMRLPIERSEEEIEFRDGSLGVLSWAIAIVLVMLMSWAASQTLSGTLSSSRNVSTSQSVFGENLIAYDLDQLFRAERRPQNMDLNYARSEAARILLTTGGRAGVTPDDRSYLVRLVAANTGLQSPEAERRTDIAIVQARDAIRKARRASIVLAFMSGAAALLGAAVAWLAADEGGRHRDGKTSIPTYLHRKRRAV